MLVMTEGIVSQVVRMDVAMEESIIQVQVGSALEAKSWDWWEEIPFADYEEWWWIFLRKQCLCQENLAWIMWKAEDGWEYASRLESWVIYFPSRD